MGVVTNASTVVDGIGTAAVVAFAGLATADCGEVDENVDVWVTNVVGVCVLVEVKHVVALGSTAVNPVISSVIVPSPM